ncbi:hypothetical protein COS75_03235 [Candidatus Pacearchaeota archaeon CG06_land_8_20_14_3_00_35_12]|nr:MAG: hypothetical protein COS75_03235 [Candidatus Pacearchaeota archaeon CG06_land_8_20_14_3_00_35_12]
MVENIHNDLIGRIEGQSRFHPPIEAGGSDRPAVEKDAKNTENSFLEILKMAFIPGYTFYRTNKDFNDEAIPKKYRVCASIAVSVGMEYIKCIGFYKSIIDFFTK